VTPEPRAVDPPAQIVRESEVTEWPTVGPSTGFPALVQSVLHCPPSSRAKRFTGPVEEVLFVLCGEGTLHVDGATHRLEADSGVYLAPGERYELEGHGEGPMRIVRVGIPDPEPAAPGNDKAIVRRLAEQQALQATTQREFRIVADPAVGLRSATHFVGYVPTETAPEHFHTYDEVIHIIAGEGELHAGDLHQRVRPGSSIQLPARTVHSLANTGPDVMRLVAVFRPAGSPAAAYYPDGTPAYPGTPPIKDPHRRRDTHE
jgi:quercetin dioxygenase-like cupin family protein